MNTEETSTITATQTLFETSWVPLIPTDILGPVGSTPPYPISTAWATSAAPSGTGSYQPSPPAFTGSASVIKLPGAIAGLLGLVALVL